LVKQAPFRAGGPGVVPLPFPASAQTSGIVATGVVLGAIVETDCASVSIGERTSPRSR